MPDPLPGLLVQVTHITILYVLVSYDLCSKDAERVERSNVERAAQVMQTDWKSTHLGPFG
jgi:hypothetical protein